ncbi:hypothetical protein [Nocardia nova]|uniref:hypothetical protein n=1 Tax=Nocardia nova TaxID=37330 RepID=UPI0033CF5EE6
MFAGQTVRLTARGVDAQASSRAILDEIDAEWSRTIGAHELRVLRTTLEAIVASEAPKPTST